MLLERLNVPIVLAPLGGGPSTPELAAAVSRAGGLGFLAAGYLTAKELGERIAATRGLGGEPLGVNLFVPGAPSQAEEYRAYLARLAEWSAGAGVELGEPRYSDDDWEAKLELLAELDPAVEVVSFTFGCPEAALIGSLKAAGSEAWVTVTSPEEALQARQAGADALVVQGAEAGGHRGSFADRSDLPVYGLLPLLALVGAAVDLPLVASGGIATGQSLAAVLAAGATAGQLGSAFMLAPEAGTGEAHRAALRRPGEPVLTRAFTGRLARGIRNRFIDEHESAAPIAYPELHYVTAPMRRQARERGDSGLVNLWAGEGHELALELPAAEIVARLAGGAHEALAAAERRLLS